MTQKRKPALPAGEEAAGSRDTPALSPVAVQNYAYLKLLKWDHLRRPFPEVGAPVRALTLTAVLLIFFKRIPCFLVKFTSQTILF